MLSRAARTQQPGTNSIRMPTHDAPDIAGADDPAAGEHRKKKNVRYEDPIRTGSKCRRLKTNDESTTANTTPNEKEISHSRVSWQTHC